jgi:hypothetical protein
VAKKDFIPALTHFCIESGRVRGYNGSIALCTPIPFDIACNPKADPLIKAIGNCDDTVILTMTPAGRLSVKSGAFKALVDCIEGETPHVEPEGEAVQIDGVSMLAALKALEPFIGNDASRPWSNGVLFKGESAFATNNVMLVEYWTGARFPTEANVPRAAIKEMLRINEPPVSAQLDFNSITFHYTGNRWLRSQLFSTAWPDLQKILSTDSIQSPVDERLFAALSKLKPFCDKMGRVFIGSGLVSTHLPSDEGASYEIPDLQHEGIYNIEMLASLEGTAKTIDWSAYPAPCMFNGDRIRGAIVGMRA